MKPILAGLLLIASIGACHRHTSQQNNSSTQNTMWKSMTLAPVCRFDEGEYGQMKLKTGDLADFEGIVDIISETTIIKSDDGTRSFMPCNAPALPKGTSVKISGEIRKIPSNMRLPGTPIKLSSLMVKE